MGSRGSVPRARVSGDWFEREEKFVLKHQWFVSQIHVSFVQVETGHSEVTVKTRTRLPNPPITRYFST